MNHSESCIFIDSCFSYFFNKTTGLVLVPLIHLYCFVMLIGGRVYGDFRDVSLLTSTIKLNHSSLVAPKCLNE